nr:rod-determining factor RdfA [Natrinema gelatinilyticum]
MTDAGMSTLSGEVSNMYRLLTADDVSSGNRTEARKRLEQNGLDIAQLERDFITYQAMRSYLKDYRGAEYHRNSETTRLEDTVAAIQRLQARTRSVAEKNLTQLRKTGQISLGEF